MRKHYIIYSTLIMLGIIAIALFFSEILWVLIIVLPLYLVGLYDMIQRKHTILRNFPIIGHFRYLMEAISPEIQQYFIERHTDGTPISRNHRKIVYERAKNIKSTHPFGTELDLYEARYRGLKHSVYPTKINDIPDRVLIGGPDCKMPYSASIYNISAMSYGALSKNAIKALNIGAKLGGFYHNTGEGGISPYHLNGGDLVWQIGTGYFGCRDQEGNFDEEKFKEKASIDSVKMIELKISQGAKPGHGGVLPGKKNSKEIASIREIEPGKTVYSPPGHTAFHDAESLLYFIKKMRELSGSKPVGMKFCLGNEEEIKDIFKKMKETGITPDFITVDGAEGGTGAAPLEFSDSVGMPLQPALHFVDKTLKEYGLREQITLIASGKLITAYSIMYAMSLGADICNAARGFMLSVGCIQAQRCDTNSCPTGVATQKPELVKGLVVADKKDRAYNYHKNTVELILELLAAAGKNSHKELSPDDFFNNVSRNEMADKV